MDYDKYSKEELIKIAQRQSAIIQNFESVSFFYKGIKNFPLIGKTARAAANVLKAKKLNGLRIIEHVKEKNPDLVAVCNPDFSLGVRAATFTLAENVIEVSEMLGRRAAKKVAKKIAEHQPKKVVISGYAHGYDLLAEELKKISPATRIFAYVHSAFIWFDVYPDENKVFNNFLELEKAGVIEKIGFCKEDVAEYFKKIGVNSYFVMNRFTIPERKAKKLNSKSKLKIGAFGANLWHRNILNQVLAGLMIPNAEIHVNEIGDHDFIDKSRVVVHGFLPKPEFDKLFAEMDINLYVSFTDCFPMNLIESMANNIPAIASDTSSVYSYNKELKESLTVSTIDGPLGIKAKIEEVLGNYDRVQKLISGYLPVLKKNVEKSISDFLE